MGYHQDKAQQKPHIPINEKPHPDTNKPTPVKPADQWGRQNAPGPKK
jgi:hypothetical protein